LRSNPRLSLDNIISIPYNKGMAQTDKYGIRDLKRDFGTEKKCLDFIFDTLHSRKCSCGGTYSLLEGRRQFQCSKCRFQIAPTAGTIFHKSPTPLNLWFYTILIFSNAKSGISAKEIERQLGVTYKTAWRMLYFIRKSLASKSKDYLKGDVEMDETWYGGRKRGGVQNLNRSQAMQNKSVIIGAVERGGEMRAEVSPNDRAKTISSFLDRNINPITSKRLITDESNRYDKVAIGYNRHTVQHNIKEFVRDDIHVNTLESFWSHVKRSTKGTHKVISKKYLQTYLDGFVFHYNNRHNDRERFLHLIGVLLPSSKAQRSLFSSF